MAQATVQTSTRTTTVDPATGKAIKTYPFQNAAELEASMVSAERGFKQWRQITIGDRAKAMARLARVPRACSEELSRLMTLEMGKAIVQSRSEVEMCAVFCDWFSEQGPALLLDEANTIENNEAYISYFPLGTILTIMPWNFPLWQAFRAAVSIMMGGNGIVLSHSKNVTGCALAMGQLFEAANFPVGAFQVIIVPTDALAGVIGDRRIAAVTLTGSVPAGRAVASEAGKVLKKCVLELGSSDAFIVLADADIDAAVEAADKVRFSNSGQICICAKRFILEAQMADTFTKKFVEAAGKLLMEDPFEEGTFLGPLAAEKFRDQIHKQVSASVNMGARLLMGGIVPEGIGAYYPPTILADVLPGMPAWDEETFGPFAAITVAQVAEEALALSNQSDLSISGNLWTGDVKCGEAFAHRMETGGLYINGYSGSDARVPSGDITNSGYGRALGHFGIHEFINAQLVWLYKK